MTTVMSGALTTQRVLTVTAIRTGAMGPTRMCRKYFKVDTKQILQTQNIIFIHLRFSICLPILLGLKLLQFLTSQVKI